MTTSLARRGTGPALLVASLLAAGHGAPVRAQLAPLPYDQGAAGLGLALRRLGVTGRVLYVTAHPDDEHNGVLVRLSRGLGLRTGLLTLTRGDGGQNEIGPELFEALGVLRTEELMAVHRYDAVEQYFARAYEFGYSFSVEETFDKWGKEATLGDVVKVVRAFRPDVMLTLSLGGGGGGQHHQAAARLAAEAFRAAADPSRFPEHARQGLRPWQARKIYQGGVGGGRETPPGAEPVALATGALDPLLGMSWEELGSIARASHRSGGTSQLRSAPGEGQGVYTLVDSEPAVTGAEADILDGVDVSLGGLTRFARAGEPASAGLGEELTALQARADAAREAFDARAPEAAWEPLGAYLGRLREVRGRLEREGGRADLLERLGDEEKDVLDALALAQGIAFEVLSDDDKVVPGQSFTVSATAANQGRLPLDVQTITLSAPRGWKAGPVEPVAARVLAPGQRVQARFEVTAAPRARYTQPYWRRPPGADRFELDVPAHDTMPFGPPDLVASLRYRAAGAEATLERPAIWRYEGPTGGEKQKVTQVVPALSVHVTPALAVVPLPARGATELRVTVVNNVKGRVAARVRLEAPPGWRVEPGEAALAFGFEGESLGARFHARPPTGVAPGLLEMKAVATREGGVHREGVQVIAYPHVQERQMIRPAAARVRLLDVRLLPGVSVGYVMGAGDEIADALRQLGARVTLLGPDDLAYGDLARFTTIVTGIRAYQTRADLKANHHRLLRYLEQGGHVVVQYNKFEFNVLVETPRSDGMIYTRPATTDSPFAPYPAAVSSARVSDENAPVEVLHPAHPLFNRPNRLGPADWAGWVQERGLYFLEARDPRYRELVSMTDPFPNNPGEKKGALVEAKVGRGTWTYVGLGLFRQIPAGTPGAWRLLANLVSRPRGAS
ncbi:MAG TPA: NEW3 domain-containing protein [Vicinamibacteria bacterium]|nr:NEW3 domain-containing protein [Vicinamibacteria bacterium]